MKFEKELQPLEERLLQKDVSHPPCLKASSHSSCRFFPFFWGMTVGWILSLCLFKFFSKKLEESGLTFFEWVMQQVFRTEKQKKREVDMSSFSDSEEVLQEPVAITTLEIQSEEIIKENLAPLSSSSEGTALRKVSNPETKRKKIAARKAKSSSKAAAAAQKAEKISEEAEVTAPKLEKKTGKKVVKSAKKKRTASKAKKTTKKSEDKS
ncbi:hypothetical protein FAI40_07145 [Acetobacteraceae bacterium]|nr:hypothetical protein FAI40_07145 [Acetobacteraceae bacterium]